MVLRPLLAVAFVLPALDQALPRFVGTGGRSLGAAAR